MLCILVDKSRSKQNLLRVTETIPEVNIRRRNERADLLHIIGKKCVHVFIEGA